MKGFTLIEMIATVVVLSFIMLIAIALVTNAINAAKEKAYRTQIETIKLAAKSWGAENLNFMPDANESITIYLWTLKNKSFINESFVNQLTNEEFNNDLAITIENTVMGYKYTVIENSGTEDLEYTDTMPTIIMRAKLKEYVKVNAPYVEDGLIVLDTEGNMISTYTTKYFDGTVEVGSINTSVPNNYTVKYTVTYGLDTYILERAVEIEN